MLEGPGRHPGLLFFASGPDPRRSLQRPQALCRGVSRQRLQALCRGCSGRARKHARPPQPRPGAGHPAPERAGSPGARRKQRPPDSAWSSAHVSPARSRPVTAALHGSIRSTPHAPCEWPARRPLAQAPPVQRRERIRRGPHAAGRRECFPDACDQWSGAGRRAGYQSLRSCPATSTRGPAAAAGAPASGPAGHALRSKRSSTASVRNRLRAPCT